MTTARQGSTGAPAIEQDGGAPPPESRSTVPVPRKHVLVAYIEQHGSKLAKDSRVDALPEMILRHGVLQTSAFLQSKSFDKEGKQTQDGQLLQLLAGCVEETTGKSLAADALVKLSLERYLVVNEAALEAATWISLLARARTAKERE